MLKKLLLLVLLFSLCVGFCSCQSNNPEGTQTSATYSTTGSSRKPTGSSDRTEAESTSSGRVTDSPEPDLFTTWSMKKPLSGSERVSFDITVIPEIYAEEPLSLNYLSGKTLPEDDETYGIARTVAVLLKNDYLSYPYQSGLETADLIFEIPAGDGTTSLLACYYNPSNIEKIGPAAPVSSCAASLAAGYDSYLFFSGESETGARTVRNLGVDAVDALTSGGKDSFLKETIVIGPEESADLFFATSGRIAKKILSLSQSGVRFIVNPDSSMPFEFKESEKESQSVYASRVHFDFGAYQPYFLYNTATRLYSRYEHGSPQKDAQTGRILNFKNVVVLFVGSSFNDASTLSGSGRGYLITNGRYTSIKWEKTSNSAPIRFTDSNGNAVLFNPGKTFITLVPQTSALDIS